MIEEVLKEKYQDLHTKPMEVYSIFSEFFGEDRVDMHGKFEIQDLIDDAKNPCILETLFFNIIFNTRQMDYYNTQYAPSKGDKEKDFSLDNPTVFELFFDLFISYHESKGILKGLSIIVHIPKVTITNERGHSIVATEFYVKVPITITGSYKGGSIYFNRGEYTVSQLNSYYMHSHISSIDIDRMHLFKSSCLGGGPIRDTIVFLNTGFDYDKWFLFCIELVQYLETESIEGGPYIRMSNISISESRITIKTLDNTREIPASIKGKYGKHLQYFLKDLIESNTLTFNYFNGSYGIAMSFSDFVLFISNSFIDWWNNKYSENLPEKDDLEYLLSHGLIKKAMYTNDGIILKSDRSSNLINLIRKAKRQKALTFKGQDVYINVIEDPGPELDVLILNLSIIQTLYIKIITIINTLYGTTNTNNSNTSSNSKESTRVQGGKKTILSSY